MTLSSTHCQRNSMPTALKALADVHELSSQDDICVLGPIHPPGQPHQGAFDVAPGQPELCARDLHPETDIRVLPHRIMADDSWEAGICAPPVSLTTKGFRTSKVSSTKNLPNNESSAWMSSWGFWSYSSLSSKELEMLGPRNNGWCMTDSYGCGWLLIGKAFRFRCASGRVLFLFCSFPVSPS